MKILNKHVTDDIKIWSSSERRVRATGTLLNMEKHNSTFFIYSIYFFHINQLMYLHATFLADLILLMV